MGIPDKMTDEKRYTYSVSWNEEDKEYVGLCAEFPSLSWLDESRDDALNGVVKIVGYVLNDMEANGEDAPEPLSKPNQEDREELDIDTTAYRLHVCQRELAYHKAVCDAAEEGLGDCIDMYLIDDSDVLDEDANGHISAWAHRVQLANISVSEVSQDVAIQAGLLSELTAPVPTSEDTH